MHSCGEGGAGGHRDRGGRERRRDRGQHGADGLAGALVAGAGAKQTASGARASTAAATTELRRASANTAPAAQEGRGQVGAGSPTGRVDIVRKRNQCQRRGPALFTAIFRKSRLVD